MWLSLRLCPDARSAGIGDGLRRPPAGECGAVEILLIHLLAYHLEVRFGYRIILTFTVDDGKDGSFQVSKNFWKRNLRFLAPFL